jgi:hypothetical protein
MRNYFKAILTLLLIQSPPVLAQDNAELARRVEALEKQQSEMILETAEGKGRVRTFLNDKVTIGGFFESGITGLWGADTASQLSANSHIFGLNIVADFDEKFRFLAQMLSGVSYPLVNQHNDPGASAASQRRFNGVTFGTLVAHAFGEYTLNSALAVQVGLGYVPFGQAFQQREPVLYLRRGGPQMASVSSATHVGLAFTIWEGIHVHGAFDIDDRAVGYNLYTFTPTTNVRTVGLGGRLWAEPFENLTLGVSGQTGREAVASYQSFGTDLKFRYGRYGFITEYAKSLISSGVPGCESYYFEPSVSFFEGLIVIYGAADFLDNTINQTSTSTGLQDDPYKLWRYGAGLNWLPRSYTRYRLGYYRHNYIGATAIKSGQDRDYHSIDLSAGIAF